MDNNDAPFSFVSAALSDTGTVRELNEDSYVTRDDIALWAVADGVGGRDAGDVASRMIAEALAGLSDPVGGKSYLETVQTAIKTANTQMLEYVKMTPEVTSIGSTIACIIAYKEYTACLWAGDSRVYRFRDGTLTSLSKDHSYVQELIDKGELSPEEAKRHPRSNVITRAIGVDENLDIAVRRDPLQQGDRFLLCSDGLSSMLTDPEIEALIAQANPHDAAHALMDSALQRGARDNVTLILVDALRN